MKRHEAIAPLSREHHNSLILAQLLKKNAPTYHGLPDKVKDKADYAQQQFNDHIKKHFEQEEAMLERIKGINTRIDEVSAEIKKEHRTLRVLFESLGNAANLDDYLDDLGSRMETHIRKEERVLFPLIQQHCSERILQEIHELLH